MSKQDNLRDYLADLYKGIASKKPGASKNPQDFRREIESIVTGDSPFGLRRFNDFWQLPAESGEVVFKFSTTVMESGVEYIITCDKIVAHIDNDRWGCDINVIATDPEIPDASLPVQIPFATLTSLNSSEYAYESFRTINVLECDDETVKAWLLANTDPVNTGEYSKDHIIDITELPTENFVENAIYRYTMEPQFSALILYDTTDGPIDLGALIEKYEFGTFEYYTADTRPTENIKMFDEENMVYPLYYIKDEDDILMCGKDVNTGEIDWISVAMYLGGDNTPYLFGGCISDIREAVDVDHYYALIGPEIHYYKYDSISDGLVELICELYVPVYTSEERTVTPSKYTQTVMPLGADYLSKVTVNPIPSNYIEPSGTLDITSNSGKYSVDVRQYAYATVNVIPPIIDRVYKTSSSLPDLSSGSYAYESTPGEIAFILGGD